MPDFHNWQHGADYQGLCAKVYVSAFFGDIQLCDLFDLTDRVDRGKPVSGYPSNSKDPSDSDTFVDLISIDGRSGTDLIHTCSIFPGSGIPLECCFDADHVLVRNLLLRGGYCEEKSGQGDLIPCQSPVLLHCSIS